MQPKAVLFDFDYTLGDCTDAIYACIGFALTTLGYGQPTLFAVRPTIGLTLPHTYAALTGDQCPEKAQEFAELFLQKADETMTKGAKLFPETLPLLRRLQEKGIKTGIVTTKLSFRIREILAKYAANDLVSVIVGESDVSHPKPHPRGFFWHCPPWTLPLKTPSMWGIRWWTPKPPGMPGWLSSGLPQAPRPGKRSLPIPIKLS